MSNSKNARSTALWIVIAVATLAIAWKLVDRTSRDAIAVGPEAHVAPEVAVATISDLELPTAGTASAGSEVAIEPTVAAPRAVPILRSDEPGDASVHGFVRPAEGGDLTGSETYVSWTDRLGTRNSTQIAEDGAYSFAGMRPGRYWFQAGSLNGGQLRVEVDVAGDRTLDLQLERQPEVRIRIVDASGAAVERFSLLVVATIDEPGAWMDEVVGSFNNTFGVGAYFQRHFQAGTLPSEFVGRIRLLVEPPVYVSLVHYQYVVATQKVEPGQSEVTFVVDPEGSALADSTLRFRAVDGRTGSALTEGMLTLVGAAAVRPRSLRDGDPSEFRTAPGWYVIHLRSKGFADPALRVRLEPGVVTDLGDIGLDTASAIAGRVLDPAGEVVSTELQYDVCGPDGATHRYLDVSLVTRCGGDGTFEIRGLASGTYRLRATGPGSQRWRGTINLCQGSVENLEIRLVETTPLVIHCADGAWENARLRIVDAAGETWADQRVYQPQPSPIQLAPASYVVEYRASPTAPPTRIPIVVGDVPLELTLP